MPSARALARVDTPDPNITWDPAGIAAALPKPEFPHPDPSKKSHARKQAPGHIPRPRNPFILFRTNFVRQQRIPNSVESDHRNISRIVGRLWNVMSDDQRDPWKKMAVREREEHAKVHPGYRFTPGVPSGSRKKKAKRGDVDIDAELASSVLKVESPQYQLEDDRYTPPRRPSSCPPGARHIPHMHPDSLRTRDDLNRRPSKITFYQSYDSPLNQGYIDLPTLHDHHYSVEPDHLPHQGVFTYPVSPHTQTYTDNRFDHHVAPFIAHPGYNNAPADQRYDDHAWSAYESLHQPVSHSDLLRSQHEEHLPAALRSPPIFSDPFSQPPNPLGDHRYDHTSSLVMQQAMRFDDPIDSPRVSPIFSLDARRKSSHFPGRVLPKPVTNAKQKRESADITGNPFSFDRPHGRPSRSLSLYIDYSGGSLSRNSQNYSDEFALPRLTRDTNAHSPTDSSLSPHTAGAASP